MLTEGDVFHSHLQTFVVCFIINAFINDYYFFLTFITSMKISVVLCEYSKFRIESNSYFSIRFCSKGVQLFQIFEYLPSPIYYLFNRMTPIFHLSNHA